MNAADLAPFLERAREMQARIESLQRELAARRFEGGAGGGMVRAVVDGALRVIEIRIEPALIAGGDVEMIQELCAAALNSALQHAQSQVQAELQRASAGLALPGLPGPQG